MMIATSGRQTFRKPERLVSAVAFRKLLRDGKSIHRPPFRLVFAALQLPTDAPAQVAFSVPKRLFPRAVDRNRIKRLMRETYRKNKNTLYPLLQATGKQWALLFIYNGRTIPSYPDVQEKLTLTLRQLDKDLQPSAG
jgi:ribonuclease P protein component